jgi:hypothetical protein
MATRAWVAVDATGRPAYPTGASAPACDRRWRGARQRLAHAAARERLAPARLSAPCDAVLVAAGPAAWVCRAAGCTRPLIALSATSALGP